MHLPPQAVLIVRRGLSKEYYTLMGVFAATRGLELIVDRRREDRRQESRPPREERRRAERRGPPPDSWDFADFIARPRAL